MTWKVELVRGAVMVLLFFIMFLPVQYYVLDPLRGVQPPPPLEELLARVCPPGTECDTGKIDLSKLRVG